MKKGSKKPNVVPLKISQDQLDAIDKWSEENHFMSRMQAMRTMIFSAIRESKK